MVVNNKFFKQRFLVTGASGFIGTPLVNRLVEHGSEVHAISRKNRSSGGTAINWWKGDCGDYTFLENVIRSCKPDVVFHLAGYAYGTRDLSAVIPSYNSNLTGTVNLLTILAGIGCEKIVLAGSMEEPDENEYPVIPSSPYAASKWACTGYANMFHALYDLPVVNTRIFMVYGPGQEREKLIPYLILSFLNNEQPELVSGERLLDWIFIDDIVDGLLATASDDNISGKRIDLGSGEQISIKKLAELLFSLTDSDKEPIIGKNSTRKMEQVKVANIADTKQKINWTPKTPLITGLKKTIEWHKNRY